MFTKRKGQRCRIDDQRVPAAADGLFPLCCHGPTLSNGAGLYECGRNGAGGFLFLTDEPERSCHLAGYRCGGIRSRRQIVDDAPCRNDTYRQYCYGSKGHEREYAKKSGSKSAPEVRQPLEQLSGSGRPPLPAAAATGTALPVRYGLPGAGQPGGYRRGAAAQNRLSGQQTASGTAGRNRIHPPVRLHRFHVPADR